MLFSSLISGPLACQGRFNRFLINAKYRPGFRRKRKARNEASAGLTCPASGGQNYFKVRSQNVNSPVAVKKSD